MDNRKLAKMLVGMAKSILSDTTKNASTVSAAKKVKVTIKADDLVEEIIGDIRGFDRAGTFYEHEDGLASINGIDVVEKTLEKLREVTDIKFGSGNRAVITFDVGRVHQFMEQSGFRAMDYTEEEAEDEINDSPMSILSSMVSQYRVSVDPYQFQVENEQPDTHVVTLDGKEEYEGEDHDEAEKVYDRLWDDLVDGSVVEWTINGERFAIERG